MPIFPLTPTILNTIQLSIKENAEAFQSNKIELEQIGTSPGGRRLVASTSWPINEALMYFHNQGAISEITPDNPREGVRAYFNIIDRAYFDINFANMELPVKFNIDTRIEADLKIMTGLYAELYDLENRLRFFLESLLKNKFGNEFEERLPAKVKGSIKREKSKTQFYIDDNRIEVLQYTQFSDLIAIIKIQGLLSNTQVANKLIGYLDYINEVRTRVAHNNILPSDTIRHIKEKCSQCRRLIED